MANFEEFFLVISSSKDLLFLQSDDINYYLVRFDFRNFFRNTVSICTNSKIILLKKVQKFGTKRCLKNSCTIS